MKKQIIAGITITACVALCAAVWPRNAEVGDLPVELAKAALNAEIEARLEEAPHIFISADISTPVTEVVPEREPQTTGKTAEKEAEKPVPMQTAQQVKPTLSSSEPRNGDVRVVDGEKQIFLLGFGWLKDEGANIGATVGHPCDELTGNKVGIMGGATVGSKGDINKQVGIKGSGDNVVSYAEDMYESGVKIGIMGDDEPPSRAATTPLVEQPEPTGDVIYAPIQPPVTKDSTPPAYKPNGEPYNP